MSIDLTKYKFIEYKRQDGRMEIIAISTFAGKPVRGKAICALDDTFDRYKGMTLAAARCNEKIARKRYLRSKQKIREAEQCVLAATRYYDNMRHYHEDAYFNMIQAGKERNQLESEL